MAKIKLTTCKNGFKLHNAGLSFDAWIDSAGEISFDGDVVFEVDESDVVKDGEISYVVKSGAEIKVLEVIKFEHE